MDVLVPPAPPDPDTYMSPRHGWTCFHCGETFFTVEAARGHFGPTPLAEPGCVIQVRRRDLLYALREAEAELARYRAEDSDKDRAMHAMQAEHAAALRCAEELGYERGLRDGRSIAATAPVGDPV